MKIDFLQIGFQKCGTTFMERNIYSCHPDIECVQAGNNLKLERLLLQKFILPDKLEYNRQIFETEIKNVIHLVFINKTARIKGIMFEPFTFLAQKRFDRGIAIDRCHESFPDIKIIISIRNQKTWILSHYSQYLKSGGLLRFHNFIESFFKNPYLDSHYIDWFSLISYIYGRFGSERVLVCLYEELRNSPQNFANKIFAFLQVRSVSIDENIVNPSLSKKTLFLRRLLNHLIHFDSGASIYNFIRDLNDAEPTKFARLRHTFVYKYYKPLTNAACYRIDKKLKNRQSFQLDPSHVEKFREKYSANNKKLSRLLNIDLSNHGYP